MVAISDVVAAKGGGSELDAFFVERVDPSASLLDEPVDSFALRWPTFMGGDVLALVCAFDLAGEVNEGQFL